MILAFCYNIGLCGNWFLKSAIYPFIHHYQGSAINKALSQAWWETKIDAKDTLVLWRAWTKGTGWLPRMAPPTQFSNSVNHGDIWSERNVVCWLWHGWLYYLLFNWNTLRGKGSTIHNYIGTTACSRKTETHPSYSPRRSIISTWHTSILFRMSLKSITDHFRNQMTTLQTN